MGALQCAVIDGPGIEGDQIVEAAAIERKIFDFAFAHDAGDGGCGSVDNGRFSGDDDLLDHVAQFQTQIQFHFLAYFQIDSSAYSGLEAVLFGANFLRTYGKSEKAKIAGIIRDC